MGWFINSVAHSLFAVLGLGLALAGAQLVSQNLPEPSPSNTLLPCEAEQGFQLLFDGTLASFQSHYANYQQGNDTNTNIDAKYQYCAADSSICTNHTSSANLRSRIKYADFDLRLDYRDDSDAGISYRGLTRTALWFQTAIEYSVDDRTNTNTFPAKDMAGGIYGIFAPNPLTYHTYSTGLWNSVRIIAKGDSVQQWMNDTLVLAYRLWGPRWDSAFAAAGKTAANTPDLAQRISGCQCAIDTGFIGFQGDHITSWHIRNLRINTNPSTLNFGPANCSTTEVQAGTTHPKFSLESLPGALLVRLNTPGALQAEVLGLNGKTAAQVGVEAGGEVVRIQAWKNPGLYILCVRGASNRLLLTAKIFLP